MTYNTFKSNNLGKIVLSDCLKHFYGSDHQVTIYEACIDPQSKPRIEYTALSCLPEKELNFSSTLYIPPKTDKKIDYIMADKLELYTQENTFDFIRSFKNRFRLFRR